MVFIFVFRAKAQEYQKERQAMKDAGGLFDEDMYLLASVDARKVTIIPFQVHIGFLSGFEAISHEFVLGAVNR